MLINRIRHYLALTMVTTLLGACQFTVQPGTGGSVSLASDGDICPSGDTCTLDTEQGFFDTLVANPEEGFVFDRWVGYEPCEQDTTGRCDVALPAVPEQFAQLLSAVEINLQAQFREAGSSSGTDTTGNTGVFLPEVRQTGFSAAYSAAENAQYKTIVDSLLQEMNSIFSENKDFIAWPNDLPVVFSGCNTFNAFYSPLQPSGVTVIDTMAFEEDGSIDATNRAAIAAAFGADIEGATIVICHEMTEGIVEKVFTLEQVQSDIIEFFEIDTTQSEEAVNEVFFEYADLTARVLALQIGLHEVGHAVDGLLLKDDVKRRDEFTYPSPRTATKSCGGATCDTLSDDFADWVSAYVFIQSMQESFAESANSESEEAAELATAWFVAAKNWQTLMGEGGDAAHGLTNERIANIVCYAVGGLTEFRAADDADPAHPLSGLISAQGIDPSSCQSTFERNNGSMDRLF